MVRADMEAVFGDVSPRYRIAKPGRTCRVGICTASFGRTRAFALCWLWSCGVARCEVRTCHTRYNADAAISTTKR